MTFKEGDKVIANGYPGTVRFVHTGDLAGMIDVHLPGGLITTCASEVELI